MFNVLLLTTLNKDEFNVILEDYVEYLPLYTCTTRTSDNITHEDFLGKDLIVFGIGDACFDIEPYIDDIKQANLAGTPIGFTHGTPTVNAWFPDDEDGTRLAKYNEYLDFVGMDVCVGKEYDFYSEVAVKNPTHPILLGPMPVNLSGNIPILTTHDVCEVLKDTADILLNNPNRPDGFDNYYVAVFDFTDGRGRIAYNNVGHNNYSMEEFFKPDTIEKNLMVNVCNWLLKLDEAPVEP